MTSCRDYVTRLTFLRTCYRKSDGVTKAAINEKRKLSANLAVTRAHLSLKAREGESSENASNFLDLIEDIIAFTMFERRAL